MVMCEEYYHAVRNRLNIIVYLPNSSIYDLYKPPPRMNLDGTFTPRDRPTRGRFFGSQLHSLKHNPLYDQRGFRTLEVRPVWLELEEDHCNRDIVSAR